MEAIEAIMTRRSTRKMSDRVPPDEVIRKVIDAGRCAPSGCNSQTTHIFVIINQSTLQDLADLVQEAFAEMEEKEELYVSLKNSIHASKRGNYVFHYNAPVLIVTANQKGYGNAIADSACALENMMIAANALNLGSCWINQLHWLSEHEKIRSYMSKLGLLENEEITGGLILGYAQSGMPIRENNIINGNPVTWVLD